MDTEEPLTFEISLSVLDHLGRHLYRSFTTVLGEAVSNAWDADAARVWIEMDADGKGFCIKDDGHGMTRDDFQSKFLKIGYSKRLGGRRNSTAGRPFIGRKGIGKLALLSCANRVTVISKVSRGQYVGGVIDNPSLDKAITRDQTPQQYPLGKVKLSALRRYTIGHTHGTIIRFDGVKEGARHTIEFLAKVIALYFRFSLIDSNFRIYLNGKQVTYKNLADLAANTEFLWTIGNDHDPFTADLLNRFERTAEDHESRKISLAQVTGFIASVARPRDLKIMTTDERVGIDLFVNGRLRERDILKHVPTARIAENYLYGQIHFNALDDKLDRFTSSREGIVADDPKYEEFLASFRKTILAVVNDWDEWRLKHRKEGDSENPRKSRAERASLSLLTETGKRFQPSNGKKNGKGVNRIDNWVAELAGDAEYNFASYAECFVSENLVRRYIAEKKLPLSPEANAEAEKWKKVEKENKAKGNVSIPIRRDSSNVNYLAMNDLANLVDKPKIKEKEASLARDAETYKPMRDAMAHTALLTDKAKARLTVVRENIASRVGELVAGP